MFDILTLLSDSHKYMHYKFIVAYGLLPASTANITTFPIDLELFFLLTIDSSEDTRRQDVPKCVFEVRVYAILATVYCRTVICLGLTAACKGS